MREFYLEELEKTLQKLYHINKILGMVGNGGEKINISIRRNSTPGNQKIKSEPPVRGRYRKKSGPSKTVRPSRKRKQSGTRSVWAKLILKELEEADRPLTYNELTDAIMASSNIPAADFDIDNPQTNNKRYQKCHNTYV